MDALRKETGRVRSAINRLEREASAAGHLLRKPSAMFNAVIDSMNEGLVLLGAAYEPIIVNGAAVRLNGFSSEARAREVLATLQGPPAGYYLVDEHGDRVSFRNWPIARARRRETFESLELTIVNEAEGEQRTVVFDGAPVHEQARDTGLYVITMRDVTARRAAEKSLRQHERELRGLTEALEEQVEERTAKVRQQAEQLRLLVLELSTTEQRERRRLATILHDHLQQLLVAANLQLRSVDEGAEPGAVGAALAKVRDMLSEAIRETRSLTVELRTPLLYEEGLLPALRWLAHHMEELYGLHVDLFADTLAQPRDVEVNALLFDCVRELLFNVVKHAETPSVTLRVSQPSSNRLFIRVQDRGKGFDASRLDDATEEDSSGYGLFSIRERVAAIGGRFVLRTRPGGGTETEIALPLEETAEIAAPADRPAEAAPTVTTAAREAARAYAGGIRVILAEDHEIVREALAKMFDDDPRITVIGQAGDGDEAIQMARALHPDVVLMDVNMPKLNGIEATRRITRQFPEIQVIGLSVLSDSATARLMREAGALAYVSKDSDPDTLIEVIRRCGPSPPA